MRRSSIPIVLIALGCLVVPVSASAHLLPYQAVETATPVKRGATRLETGLAYDSYAGAGYDYTLLVKLAYGALNNMDAEVELPYLFVQRDRTDNGFGDIRLRSKVRFLKGREASPLSFAGQIIGKIPSGARSRGLGTGGPDIGFLFIATKDVFPATVHANLGYTFVGNSSDRQPGEKALESSLGYAVGVEFETVWQPLRLLAELAGQTHNPRDANNDPSLQLLGGVTYEVQDRVVVMSALGLGARSTAAGSPNHTITLGLAYTF